MTNFIAVVNVKSRECFFLGDRSKLERIPLKKNETIIGVHSYGMHTEKLDSGEAKSISVFPVMKDGKIPSSKNAYHLLFEIPENETNKTVLEKISKK